MELWTEFEEWFYGNERKIMGAAPLAHPIMMGIPTQPFRAGLTSSGRPSGPRWVCPGANLAILNDGDSAHQALRVGRRNSVLNADGLAAQVRFFYRAPGLVRARGT
jgi:hypothetical protein